MVDRTPAEIPLKGKKRYPSLDMRQSSEELNPNPTYKSRHMNVDAHYFFYHFDYRNRGEPNFMKIYHKERCNSMTDLNAIRMGREDLVAQPNNFMYAEEAPLRSRASRDRCNSVENEERPQMRFFGNTDRKGGRQFLRSRSAVNLATLN
ncbi:MAG: hypothetical protein MJ252_16520 [archaeon]|nr:hypothetical protein [archaeon]